MAMRPALKKIAAVLKEQPNIMELSGYTASREDTFIKKHCVKLRHPVLIPAGTKWISKSSSDTTKGQFMKNCKVIGVVDYIGMQAVLDKKSSISESSMKAGAEPDFLEQLSSLDAELLEKIAAEV